MATVYGPEWFTLYLFNVQVESKVMQQNKR
jgi:hypothetical protein